MRPIIPHRKDYNKLKPIEKSGVLYVGSVYREIFDAQVEGRYKFEIRCNFNALGHAWVPQFVVPGRTSPLNLRSRTTGANLIAEPHR